MVLNIIFICFSVFVFFYILSPLFGDFKKITEFDEEEGSNENDSKVDIEESERN